ncbi:hypothetical protein nACB2_155 [Acinetobacter phage nACB2]|nr:hypothetical protein nACB2_155 [Acinetobacter phage nACB2]
MKAGIDYSMSCPAIYIQRDDGSEKWYIVQEVLKLVQETETISVERHPKYNSKIERAIHLAKWAVGILRAEGVEVVNVEGFSMGASNGNAIFDIGAHGGILFYEILKHNIAVNFIPPSTAKKSFTGNGSAKKEDMCAKFFELKGWRFSDVLGVKENDSPENDLVDAYAIAHCDVLLDPKAKAKMFM